MFSNILSRRTFLSNFVFFAKHRISSYFFFYLDCSLSNFVFRRFLLLRRTSFLDELLFFVELSFFVQLRFSFKLHFSSNIVFCRIWINLELRFTSKLVFSSNLDFSSIFVFVDLRFFCKQSMPKFFQVCKTISSRIAFQ